MEPANTAARPLPFSFSLCSVACVLLQQRCNTVAEHPFTAAQGEKREMRDAFEHPLGPPFRSLPPCNADLGHPYAIHADGNWRMWDGREHPSTAAEVR
jgi:hypothetical protein